MTGSRNKGETVMKFFIPNHSGHDLIEFDQLDPAQLEAASAKFMELVQGEKKVAGTRKKGSSDLQRINDPAQLQDETVFARQVQGG